MLSCACQKLLQAMVKSAMRVAEMCKCQTGVVRYIYALQLMVASAAGCVLSQRLTAFRRSRCAYVCIYNGASRACSASCKVSNPCKMRSSPCLRYVFKRRCYMQPGRLPLRVGARTISSPRLDVPRPQVQRRRNNHVNPKMTLFKVFGGSPANLSIRFCTSISRPCQSHTGYGITHAHDSLGNRRHAPRRQQRQCINSQCMTSGLNSGTSVDASKWRHGEWVSLLTQRGHAAPAATPRAAASQVPRSALPASPPQVHLRCQNLINSDYPRAT